MDCGGVAFIERRRGSLGQPGPHSRSRGLIETAALDASDPVSALVWSEYVLACIEPLRRFGVLRQTPPRFVLGTLDLTQRHIQNPVAYETAKMSTTVPSVL